jgi:hemoglobin-like flavoprotein
MVTPEQVTLIKESWRKVVPIAHLADGLFYRKLFELDPSLRPIFKDEMREKGDKLMEVIAVAVEGLDNLDEIVPAVQELGVKHLEYGVNDSHYDTFGAAL